MEQGGPRTARPVRGFSDLAGARTGATTEGDAGRCAPSIAARRLVGRSRSEAHDTGAPDQARQRRYSATSTDVEARNAGCYLEVGRALAGRVPEVAVTRRYTVLLQSDPDEGGYTVTVPALPGCVSEGDTLEEALENAKDAIETLLAYLEEKGRAIPLETTPPQLACIEV